MAKIMYRLELESEIASYRKMLQAVKIFMLFMLIMTMFL